MKCSTGLGKKKTNLNENVNDMVSAETKDKSICHMEAD